MTIGGLGRPARCVACRTRRSSNKRPLHGIAVAGLGERVRRACALELVKGVARTMKSAHGAESLNNTTANSVAYEYPLTAPGTGSDAARGVRGERDLPLVRPRGERRKVACDCIRAILPSQITPKGKEGNAHGSHWIAGSRY